MKGLFLKDIMNLKQQAKIYFIIIALWGVVGFINRDGMFFGMCMILFTIMIPMVAMSYDDKSKWDRYALTMPVSRRDMVLSKYLLALAFAAFALLITFLFNYCISLNFSESLTTSLTFFLIGMVVSSITLPIFFKFGVEKGRFIMMASILVPTVISLIASKLNLTLPDGAALQRLLPFAPFLGVLCIALSIFLSIRIYTKKEF